MIIDSHTHIGGGKKPVSCTKELLLVSMAEAGIDHTIVIAGDLAQFGLMGEYGTQGVIDRLAGETKLSAVGSVDFDQLAEPGIFTQLFTHIEKKAIVGVKIYPGYADLDPTDRRLDPLYDCCQQAGLPVIIHTGILVNWAKGLLRQVHPLHLDEVAVRFPKLTLIMAHFGNPWLADAAAVVAKNPNIFIDLSGYFSEYRPIQPNEVKKFVADLTYFRDFVGDFRHCLFGTDWPLYSQKEYLAAVRQLPLTAEEQELVLWQNANRLFSLGLSED